ncbi:MAG: hypothetical protein CVV44_15135 [Spirochaetae bacterium HGW-Spirochaetae-1]|jgi:SAM-dependent methyltransferase|nr:MAG: hypothetical protein CVV44_15135 [Spirochaetae bacterium HGW-Spirochaetae-1]
MSKPIPENILQCPACGSDQLLMKENSIECHACKMIYLKNGKRFYFVEKNPAIHDTLDGIKHALKPFAKIYNFMIWLASPVFSFAHHKHFIQKYIAHNDIVAINLGSGNSNISDNISNIDLFPYENVDLTCDMLNIPFSDNSVDCVITLAALEHVPHPEKAVQDMHRILKPGGMVCCYMPFIVGFHASPGDYTRLTTEGLKTLFENFDLIDMKVGGGPTSGLLWILQEWLALVLSFGSKKLHLILYIIIMLLTFPLKFLDIILIHHPMAHNIASGFFITARKK